MARLLRIAEVEKITGFKKSTIYKMAKQGSFPKPIKAGERASAWVEAEVDAWIAARIAESREN